MKVEEVNKQSVSPVGKKQLIFDQLLFLINDFGVDFMFDERSVVMN